MTYDDARLKAIAAEECRILRRKELLVRIAILSCAGLFALEMLVMAWMR